MNVGTCLWCGGTGNVIPRDPESAAAQCPQCSGSGRVVGVPDGVIVLVCGDVVKTFPVIPTVKDFPTSFLYPQTIMDVAEESIAVVNLVMQPAPQGEEGTDETR